MIIGEMECQECGSAFDVDLDPEERDEPEIECPKCSGDCFIMSEREE